jgi:hypothetical protein
LRETERIVLIHIDFNSNKDKNDLNEKMIDLSKIPLVFNLVILKMAEGFSLDTNPKYIHVGGDDGSGKLKYTKHWLTINFELN